MKMMMIMMMMMMTMIFKVDIPLMDDFRCNAALKLAINRRQQGVGDRSVMMASDWSSVINRPGYWPLIGQE